MSSWWRRIVVSGSLIAVAVQVSGCSDDPEAAPAPSSVVVSTTAAPRPMAEYLVDAADTPGITYVTPPAGDAVLLGTLGVMSGAATPECTARNSAIRLVGTDPMTTALVRVATVDGVPHYDTQIAVLDRVVDVEALSATMRACPAVNVSVVGRDGSESVVEWEVPVTREIAGAGPVWEMSYIRELGNRSSGSIMAAAVARFVTVGDRTVVEYISGDLGSYDPALPEESIAFGDRLLAAQVAVLRR